MKRKKRERVACLSSLFVYTRWYVYQQTFFLQNFPPQHPPPFEIFLDPRLQWVMRSGQYTPLLLTQSEEIRAFEIIQNHVNYI